MIPAKRIAYDSSLTLSSDNSRVATWRSRLRQSLLLDSVLAPEQAQQLAWGIEVHHFGCLLGIWAQLSPQRFSRATDNLNRGHVDSLHVLLVLSGGLRGSTARGTFSASPGDLLLNDQLQAGEVCLDQPTTLIAGLLPRSAFPATQNPQHLHGLVLRGASPIGKLLGTHLQTLMACSHALSPGEALAFGEASRALLVHALSTCRGLSGADQGHSLLSQLCLYIEQHLAQSTLGQEQLCQHFALSRTGLYRLFEPLGGVAQFIRQRRLDRARRQLLDPRYKHLQIAQVARNHGLQPETFSRLFNQAFGLSPRVARQQHTRPEPTLHNAPHLAWLRAL